MNFVLKVIANALNKQIDDWYSKSNINEHKLEQDLT